VGAERGDREVMYPELHGSLVVLRPLHRRYFKSYIAALSPYVRARLHLHDISSELAYLHTCIAKMHLGQTFFYLIFDRKSDYLIGALEIRDHSNGSGQLYSWINDQYWGTGHFKEALLRVSHLYFVMTGMPFFSARVDVTNQRSHHALTKCGFAQAGIHQGPRGKQYELILRRR